MQLEGLLTLVLVAAAVMLAASARTAFAAPNSPLTVDYRKLVARADLDFDHTFDLSDQRAAHRQRPCGKPDLDLAARAEVPDQPRGCLPQRLRDQQLLPPRP